MFPSFLMNGLMNRKNAMSDEDAPEMAQSYGQMPSFLDAGQPQPEAPNGRQMFLGGLKNTQGSGKNPLLRGMSGFAGSGGVMGGLGKIASFMI